MSLWIIKRSISAEPFPEDQYALGPDSEPQPGVAEGKVLEFTLKRSKIYPGFAHHGWLYIPAQYDGKRSIPLMVFLDGTWFATRDGDWRSPVVLNNLIAKKALPVMAAVFVDPGHSTKRSDYTKAPDGSPLIGTGRSDQRSVEYDTLNADYARFLIHELLPKVRRHVRITEEPQGRGIAGCSSGGLGAFTVAWLRPDQFRKVLSLSGSFTNIRGGDRYPTLVRQAEKKPIRVFLQSGTQDMVVPEWGSWPQANKEMAAALAEKGYDYRFVFDQNTHCGPHGQAIFPEALRWLWRDYR